MASLYPCNCRNQSKLKKKGKIAGLIITNWLTWEIVAKSFACNVHHTILQLLNQNHEQWWLNDLLVSCILVTAELNQNSRFSAEGSWLCKRQDCQVDNYQLTNLWYCCQEFCLCSSHNIAFKETELQGILQILNQNHEQWWLNDLLVSCILVGILVTAELNQN